MSRALDRERRCRLLDAAAALGGWRLWLVLALAEILMGPRSEGDGVAAGGVL